MTGGAIYFGVVFWGARFRETFVNYSLASLLAPGNIPALPNLEGKNRFLIGTTLEDWQQLQTHPTFQRLKNHIQPEFFPLQFTSEEEFRKLNNALNCCKMYNMTQGHIEIVKRMHSDGAVGSIVIPDSVYADGSINTAYQFILRGKKLILVHCPRFATNALANAWARRKYIVAGQPLVIAPRELVKEAMQYVHVDIRMQQWEAPFIPEFILDLCWPLPDQLGVLFHAVNWWQVFINYAMLPSHDTACLEDNTVDGTYLYKNFSAADVHLITDSDEFLLITFGEHLNRRLIELPNYDFPFTAIRDLPKISVIREMIKNMMYRQIDPLKVGFFDKPIYLHSDDLTADCYRVEKKTQKVIRQLLAPASLWEQFIVRISQLPYEQRLQSGMRLLFKKMCRRKFIYPLINITIQTVGWSVIILYFIIKKIFFLKSNKKPLLFTNKYLEETLWLI